jgi:hypothetical protein
MLSVITSSIRLPRTTSDIDATVLDELRRRQRLQGKSLGQLASELLAYAIGETDDGEAVKPVQLHWTTRRMGARLDLEDPEAVRAALDSP